MLTNHYLVVTAVVLLVAGIAARFTVSGIKDWYPTIKIPSWTPAGSLISRIWLIIYICSAISAIMFWNKVSDPMLLKLVMGLFIVNGFLNLIWTYIFFVAHKKFLAVVDVVLLTISVLLLMISIWPVSMVASLLLLPYILWTAVVSFLSYTIWKLNESKV